MDALETIQNITSSIESDAKKIKKRVYEDAILKYILCENDDANSPLGF